jgi:hypothetical protein
MPPSMAVELHSFVLFVVKESAENGGYTLKTKP